MPQLMTPGLILGENEKFLLYGEFGTGKTFIGLTAPDPIWAIGVGGANEFKTGYSKPFLHKIGRKEVFIDSLSEPRDGKGQMSDNPRGFDYLCDKIDEGLEWNAQNGNIIQTLLIDNATVAEEYMMNKAIAAEFATAGNVEKTTLKREREFGIRKPGDNTYGGAQSLMDRLTGWLFELPFHIVFIAHEHKEWSADDGNARSRRLTGVSPLFVGKQRTLIPNKFDNVWRTTVSGGGRSRAYNVQTVGDEKVAAKTRVGGILDPSNERDVNLTDVIAQFKKHATELETE